jgi:hypothetical protein
MKKIEIRDRVVFEIDGKSRHKKIISGRVIYENEAFYTIKGKNHNECVTKNDIHCNRAVILKLKKASA